MTALLTACSRTHIHPLLFSKYTFESFHENTSTLQVKTCVCWNHSHRSFLCCFSKSGRTITATTTNNTKLICWEEQRFYSRKTPEAFRHKMAQYLAIGDDTTGSGMSPFSTDSGLQNAMLYIVTTLSNLFSPHKDNKELFPHHPHKILVCSGAETKTNRSQ